MHGSTEINNIADDRKTNN